MNQYALLNKGSSIHSPCQFEWYKNDVNDKSFLVPGGLQRIQTLDGYIIPLSIQDGFKRLNISPYTDQEFDALPHVIRTSALEWDPFVLDHTFKEDEQWGEAPTFKSQFDEIGNYTQRVILHHNTYFERQDGITTDDVIDQCIYATHMFTTIEDQEGNIFYNAYQHEIAEAPNSTQVIAPKTTAKRSPDFQLLRPFFGWMSANIIQKTFEHTTQYARLRTGTMLKKAFKSPHPAMKVNRRNEDVACDIIYSNVPAIFDGTTADVIFFGTSSKFTDVHGIKCENQFANALEDTIIQRGAPNRILSDRGQAIISHKVEDILQTFCHSALTNGKVNHTSTTRILRNDATRPLRTLLIASLIILVHLHTYGYCAYNMFATYLIIRIT
jgi:hypothetical protein